MQVSRGINALASAILRGGQKILDSEPTITSISTWCDSCVPQNRNQMVAYVMALCLQNNPHLTKINMLYSTPGHGCVQEVDNIHSQIEKSFSKLVFYSPVSLVRLLTTFHKDFNITQLKTLDILNIAECSVLYNNSSVPFSKVTELLFTSQNLFEVKYKTSHAFSSWTIINLQKEILLLIHQETISVTTAGNLKWLSKTAI